MPTHLDTGHLVYERKRGIQGDLNLTVANEGARANVAHREKVFCDVSGIIAMKAIHFVMFTKVDNNRARTIAFLRRVVGRTKVHKWYISKGIRELTWDTLTCWNNSKHRKMCVKKAAGHSFAADEVQPAHHPD